MGNANDFMLKEDRELLAARFEERRQAWEKTRDRGRAFYVVLSMLKLGGLIIAWRLLLDYFTERSRIGRDFDQRSIEGYAVVLIVSALIGMWEWRSNEKRYARDSESSGRAL